MGDDALLPPANEVCEGYVFTPLILFTGGFPGPHPEGEVGDLGGGGGSPGPHKGGVKAHTQGVSRPIPRGVQAQAQEGGGVYSGMH